MIYLKGFWFLQRWDPDEAVLRRLRRRNPGVMVTMRDVEMTRIHEPGTWFGVAMREAAFEFDPESEASES